MSKFASLIFSLINSVKILFLSENVVQLSTLTKAHSQNFKIGSKLSNCIKTSCITLRYNSTKDTNEISDFRQREEEKERQISIEDEEKEKSNEKDSEEQKLKEIKYAILDAALEFVATDGWTRQAIIKGTEKVGYAQSMHGLFSEGGIDLIYHFYSKCNQELIDKMHDKVSGAEKPIEPKEFLFWAVQERLLMIEPFIKSWPQALAMMTLPQNVPKSLANILTLADDICYYNGDRSVDHNWYTRRIGLAMIYKATELYILQDRSAGFENTWTFLNRRITDAILINELMHQSENATHQLSEAVKTGFETARNILGLNFSRK